MRFATLLLGVLANGFAWNASAGSLTTLHQFTGGTDGATPMTELIAGGGHIYGTTPDGRPGISTVFGIDPATGVETQVYAFPTKKFESYGPLAYKKPLLYGEDGRDIYSIDPSAGVEQSLVSYGAISGLFSGNGLLYGTSGGAQGLGAIIDVNTRTKAVTTLYSFQGGSQGDGAYPGGLTIGKNTIYGVTGVGGAHQYGTVYSLDLPTRTETVLYSFAGGKDGGGPVSRPLLMNGLLYGTTSDGISGTPGTLYSLDPTTGAKQIVYVFTGGYNATVVTGQLCYTGGHLYGVSAFGGANNAGAIYDVDITTGMEQVVYSFKAGDGNGQQPEAGMVYVNGAFYGTTSVGDGKTYYGTVFRFTP